MHKSIEQVILDRLHTLDYSRLTEVLNFVEFLADRDAHSPAEVNKKAFHGLRGKYRNLMSSSFAFAELKSVEKSLEEQRFVKLNSLQK